MGKLNYSGALSYIEQGLSMESVPNRRALLQNQIICMEYTGDFAGAYEVMTAYTAAYPDDAQRNNHCEWILHQSLNVFCKNTPYILHINIPVSLS